MGHDTTINENALSYHEYPRPGKIATQVTKAFVTQGDLSLAYTPGVAAPCLAIQTNPLDAYRYTSKGNLVAVISNGTAVLGLGNLGALASKPVMEGKAMLFKKFSDLNSYDIEVDETDIERFCDVVVAIAPTFGGINLEDIKAPECFEIEHIMRMAPSPIIFTLANPVPKIFLSDTIKARPDAIVATGRSDFPNQVNNVLGFPFIFRGAMDVRAKTINMEMKVAAFVALATGPFTILCQSGKIKNTQGMTYDNRSRCRAICS